MTVFKTFLKIVNKRKAPILMYTIFLVIFSTFNMQANDTTVNFVASKPDVVVINEDKEGAISEHLVSYLEDKTNIKDIKRDEESLGDALFYRDVNYIIYIPSQFTDDFLMGKNPNLEVKSTGDYQASLAEMMLSRYLEVVDIYRQVTTDKNELIRLVDDTLEDTIAVEMTTKLDTNSLEKASTYYNFTNYCILAGAIYIITLVLAIFKEKKVEKRTLISSMNFKKYNRQLLLSNGLFAFALWAIYVILSFILLGKVMWSVHGVLFIFNSLVFTICALSLAFLLGNLVSNKEAINGIVNVIALGSSFLCGAFVPMEWLPDSVLRIAHILPSYWFISTNDVIKTIEVFDWDAVKPIFLNMGMVLVFTLVFVLITNIVSHKKRHIG